ncbi:hypothetical protein BDW74DRAFT_187221 [Aspergillus multicolor]|uniref:2EXR domain-containing protein n=1 Tax=Aspergillus multicolor TaxID=41759 RepID=UPI003CCDA809
MPPSTLPTNPPETFTLFPSLPAELRLQIWSSALHNTLSLQRTVSISCTRILHPTTRRRIAESFSSSTPSPALLFVNRESRNESLKVWRASFLDLPEQPQVEFEGVTTVRGDADGHQDENDAGDRNGDESQGQNDPPPEKEQKAQPRPIYIAYTHETLHLREDVLPYIPEAEVCLIERMAVDVADVHYFGHFYLDILRRMGRLRKIDLVVGVSDSERLVAEWDDGHSDGDGHGNVGGVEGWDEDRRFFRGIELLRDEVREMREAHQDWDCPEVRIVVRHDGRVLGAIKGGKMEDEEDEDVGASGLESGLWYHV